MARFFGIRVTGTHTHTHTHCGGDFESPVNLICMLLHYRRKPNVNHTQEAIVSSLCLNKSWTLRRLSDETTFVVAAWVSGGGKVLHGPPAAAPWPCLFCRPTASPLTSVIKTVVVSAAELPFVAPVIGNTFTAHLPCIGARAPHPPPMHTHTTLSWQARLLQHKPVKDFWGCNFPACISPLTSHLDGYRAERKAAILEPGNVSTRSEEGSESFKHQD